MDTSQWKHSEWNKNSYLTSRCILRGLTILNMWEQFINIKVWYKSSVLGIICRSHIFLEAIL